MKSFLRNIDFVGEKHIDRTRPESTSFVCTCTCSYIVKVVYTIGSGTSSVNLKRPLLWILTQNLRM